MITALILAPASQLPLLLGSPGFPGQLSIGCGLFAQLFGAVTHGPTQRTVRHLACAPDMQGRMQATGQWTAFGLRPFAALLAGYAGTALGLRTTLALGACLLILPPTPAGPHPDPRPVSGHRLTGATTTRSTTHTPRRCPMRPARQATPDDAAEIVRLRSDLILSEPLDDHWLTVCTTALAERLTPGGDARAYVIEAPAGGLASCSLGLIHPVLPAPKYPKGLAARIHAVATDLHFQRRGYAKATLTALLDHLERDGVTLFELYASEGSAPLYARLGFASNPALMRMTRFPAQPSPGVP
ncbi:GNAT family N-acetyltransferase [Streptomyces sp. NPDC058280]|uniref:GNAT family N-acetyltransferase n=1 Tax=Streptomyces sp. NPDC058280 TaxID=3346419 RepID=UPI0036E5B780